MQFFYFHWFQKSIVQAQFRIKRSKNHKFYIGRINYKLRFTPTTCITITIVSLKCEDFEDFHALIFSYSNLHWHASQHYLELTNFFNFLGLISRKTKRYLWWVLNAYPYLLQVGARWGWAVMNLKCAL